MYKSENMLMNRVLENNDFKKIVITEDDNFVIKTIYDKIDKLIIVEEKDKQTGVQSKTITKIGIKKTSAMSA
ncbi:MAG: hypothetical protein CVU95_00660 [Firmicutes bacterium HGW-Firmicutes-2]|jgi:hypothetical protein|nr:MAG: hypothetical protein CVU95_00660 [Firmicutes bacterium HGW-Firmicutes-2]